MDGGITERLRPGAQLSLDGATGLLRVRRYQLRVSSGPDVGKTQPLDGTVMVGTAAEVGFRLTDASVSRYHLELQVRAEGVHVRDLGSTNGTSVEGARIQELTAVDLAFFAGRTGLRIERVFEEGGVALLPLGLDHFGEVVGASAGMRRIFALLTQVAPLDVGVLLLGETGTGKELLARALHKASGRGAFVTVDCGSLSPSLAEGELFGHVRGAFTGATSDREGLLAQAEGGTLFLDGVDALPLELQPKLLRFLETRTFRPLGASTERRANVRIVAATQRDLKAQVDRGQFRQDLYFRLQGVELGVPPLRERPEDLPLLIRDLLAAQGRAELTLPEALLQRLVQHPWPGNVRELRTLLERFLVSDGSADAALDAFRHSPAPLEPLTALPFKAAKQRLVDDFTREYLAQMLERAGNNVTEAARLSGIARTHFHELLAKYGVTPDGAG